MTPRKDPALVPVERITHAILIVRGQRALLDADLAALYGVATKVLLQAVKRNLERFPEDFMLRLTTEEWSALRSQIVTSNAQRGGRRYAPYAFTEQGVAMLSSVLNSSRAIAVNIEVMRAFVRMRDLLTSNKELAQKLTELADSSSGLCRPATRKRSVQLPINCCASPCNFITFPAAAAANRLMSVCNRARSDTQALWRRKFQRAHQPHSSLAKLRLLVKSPRKRVLAAQC